MYQILMGKDNIMCDCIDLIDKKLEEAGENTIIDVPIAFGPEGISAIRRPIIATKKRDAGKRQKPKRMFASYCPFCGEKIDT